MIPIIPLPGKVIFPRTNTPLNVVRQVGVLATKFSLSQDKMVLLLNQKNADLDELTSEDFYSVGTVAKIVDSFEPGDDTVRIAVETERRGIVKEILIDHDIFLADITIPSEDWDQSEDVNSLRKKAVKSFSECMQLKKKLRNEVLSVAKKEKDPGVLADYIANYAGFRGDKPQQILGEVNSTKRLEMVVQFLEEDLEVVELDRRIEEEVEKSVKKTHREFYLNERMKAIQKELGRGEDGSNEFHEIEKQIQEAGMSEEALEKANKELKRLQQMQPMSAESGVIRTYLDWLVSLPWSNRTNKRISINRAETILNADHYGLEKPKDRILEYLAVMKLVKKIKGPILCLVGPPGVGKTSLGKSIANATGRNFVRMSLGGVRDEAEVRGHRRTYIGSLPGRIIHGLRDAKSKNPLFLLDEVDKMSSDFRGDPASALLEVLDPEQNDTFRDHYLDVDFDLSEVMFIMTANSKSSIPIPLLDRMEVIDLPGYTEFEKLKIAQQFLVPKQIKSNGLNAKLVNIDDTSVGSIINHYTKEAGVRGLERQISKCCRKIARQVAKNGKKHRNIKINADNISDFLGPHQFKQRQPEEQDEVGVATGMVYTQVGGDIVAIEATTMRGEGELTLTGQLGDVMKESAQTALAYIRSQSEKLELPIDFTFSQQDFHIHVPEGAVPKEGPSAGITIATAMVSAMTGQHVRKDVAMTGEITLRGRVLPIGGLKEKILAAHRNQIHHVIIPEENSKDLPEIPEDVRSKLEFHQVENMTQVLDLALRKE